MSRFILIHYLHRNSEVDQKVSIHAHIKIVGYVLSDVRLEREYILNGIFFYSGLVNYQFNKD